MSKKNTLTADGIKRLELGRTHDFDDCEDLDLLSNDNYRAIDEGHVVRLVESIKEAGLKTEVSIVVKVSPDGKRTCLIEDGHHRVEAVRRLRERARLTGNDWLSRPLPCRVRVIQAETEQRRTSVDSVLKNQLKKEETVWDKADAYKRLRDAGEGTQAIASMVGVDERSVRRALSLHRIPADVRAFAEANADGVKVASLYKLASALTDDGGKGGGWGNDTDFEAMLVAKAGDNRAAAAAKAAVAGGGDEKKRVSVEKRHQAMAAFLALDFIKAGPIGAMEGVNGEEGTKEETSAEAIKKTGGKGESGKRIKRTGGDLPFTANGVEVGPIDDKNQWRVDVMTRIKKIGLDDETLNAVRAAVME
jgi:hypothetical protein